MKKVIFSDIDGVLNCTQSYIKNNEDRLFYGRHSLESMELYVKSHMAHIDYERLELLKQIALRTGASVVFASSWIGLPDLAFDRGRIYKAWSSSWKAYPNSCRSWKGDKGLCGE